MQEVDHVLEAVIEGLVDHGHLRDDSRENSRSKRKRNNIATYSSVVKSGTGKENGRQNLLGTKKGIFDLLNGLDDG